MHSSVRDTAHAAMRTHSVGAWRGIPPALHRARCTEPALGTRSAAHFGERVAHFDVECSKTDASKKFCEAQEVTGFPTLKL